MVKDSSVTAYLEPLPAEQRAALERVREQLAALLPAAEESISYGIPTFKLNGRAVVWYAAWKNHLSLYPLTDTFLQSHAAELEAYRRTKGSIHFTPDAPLPEALLEELVRSRLADLERGEG